MSSGVEGLLGVGPARAASIAASADGVLTGGRLLLEPDGDTSFAVSDIRLTSISGAANTSTIPFRLVRVTYSGDEHQN